MTSVFLTPEAVLLVGGVATGFPLNIRDQGNFDSAVLRPRTTIFGADAYPTLYAKAAALMQSIARNHPFVDGNKRTAWASAWAFLRLNGVNLAADYDVDDAERFVLDVAVGAIEDIEAIAGRFAEFAESAST
ncbi:type II toxin-antitoxin system death-on-curing family toxin [Tsukamurella pseudospumae]|uniref:Fido domain-containing protein n=1 Tax=Tsukamurella pseudospumae TaxID=239498 RepID=A0A137ZZ45_9ACTN|nr:type II toxin-antitoxin system death-on-curing family toxin [Tsukamurella pseudospumae]KXO97998.1 hypothetical protein AXK61_20765 [Tsukamurella pseudospumae]KXP03471.1 hypothetical protein AXK60_16755 [Tsukamurella pseudospumae]